MDCAEWRPYRRHLIVARRSGLLGRLRWDVWHRGDLVGSFGDLVGAELHVDARLREISRQERP
jgi:hypothetical protein